MVPSESFLFFSVFVGIFSCYVRLSFGVNTCLPIQTLWFVVINKVKFNIYIIAIF